MKTAEEIVSNHSPITDDYGNDWYSGDQAKDMIKEFAEQFINEDELVEMVEKKSINHSQGQVYYYQQGLTDIRERILKHLTSET